MSAPEEARAMVMAVPRPPVAPVMRAVLEVREKRVVGSMGVGVDMMGWCVDCYNVDGMGLRYPTFLPCFGALEVEL
jgi:hypothetical protein